jgi:hypothetical protein
VKTIILKTNTPITWANKHQRVKAEETSSWDIIIIIITAENTCETAGIERNELEDEVYITHYILCSTITFRLMYLLPYMCSFAPFSSIHLLVVTPHNTWTRHFFLHLHTDNKIKVCRQVAHLHLNAFCSFITVCTYHTKCMMNRNTPGTTRSSEPTDHRRRNTTRPGIWKYKAKGTISPTIVERW